MKESMWNCPRIHETERQWDGKCGRRIGSFSIKGEECGSCVLHGGRVSDATKAGWMETPTSTGMVGTGDQRLVVH